jgi:hypothetical protein
LKQPLTIGRYKSVTLRSRIIPLNPAFLEYLREDGLWLPDEPNDKPYEETPWSEQNRDKSEDPEWESEAMPNNASKFLDVHQKIQAAIKELGGSVVPKLNWSTPKDATHMALNKNTMECQSPQDIYLLLKSSDFITHDLEHAFDDCIDTPPTSMKASDIPYILVLRPYFQINTAFEFRCFVRDRTLIGISQRDLKYVGYSDELLATLQTRIQDFFRQTLSGTFPDSNYVFDVYIPEPHDRVRLIDINPWAPRTDPLPFSWLQLLTLEIPGAYLGTADSSSSSSSPPALSSGSSEDTSDDSVEIEVSWRPEFRIVKKDDPEAYNFGNAPYGAYKLPKDVVDASQAGGGAMKELMNQWQKLMNGELQEESSDDDDDADDAEDDDEGGGEQKEEEKEEVVEEE